MTSREYQALSVTIEQPVDAPQCPLVEPRDEWGSRFRGDACKESLTSLTGATGPAPRLGF